jgi:hypothetical protein
MSDMISGAIILFKEKIPKDFQFLFRFLQSKKF